jgi:hypothetical protein
MTATRRMLAEYADPAGLVHAIQAQRLRGYRLLEAYTPYPILEVDRALEARPSRLSYFVFAVGLSAAATAYFLQWLISAVLYPLDTGGRPKHFPLAFVPITFEMMVLFSAFAGFFAVLWLGRLLTLWNPVFEADGFESATGDGYWLEVSAADPLFDPVITARELGDAGALRISIVGGPL